VITPTADPLGHAVRHDSKENPPRFTAAGFLDDPEAMSIRNAPDDGFGRWLP